MPAFPIVEIAEDLIAEFEATLFQEGNRLRLTQASFLDEGYQLTLQVGPVNRPPG